MVLDLSSLKITGESSDSSTGNCSRVHWHIGMTLDHLLSIHFHHLIKHSEHILSQIKLTWSNISVRERQIWTVARGGCGAGFVSADWLGSLMTVIGWVSYPGRWRRCLSPRTPHWRTPGRLRGWGTWTRRHYPAWSAGQPHGLCRAPWTLVCGEKSWS